MHYSISRTFGHSTPVHAQPSSRQTNLVELTKRLQSSKAGLLGGTSMAMALSACGGGGAGSGNGAVDKPLNISSEATGTRLFSFDTLTENADVALSSANAVDLQTSNIQNLNITTTDGASILKSLSGDSLETVTIAGDQDITIENFADATNPNIDIDASELKGDLQAVLSSRGNSNVVGGAGEDIITILGNFNDGVYSENEQINDLANNASLEISDVFGGAGIDLSQFEPVRSAEGTFSLGDGNDKVISYGALSSNGLTLEGVETLEIHSLFTTNSFFLQHWGGNEIIFVGSQDHTLRIQIVEDIATGEYITDIDMSMITVAQGNLNIEIYGPPGITLDADYDVSEVNVVNPTSSQVEVAVFSGNRELVMEPSDVIFAEQTIQIAENANIGTALGGGNMDDIMRPDATVQVGYDWGAEEFEYLSHRAEYFSFLPLYSSEQVISPSISFDYTPIFVAAVALTWDDFGEMDRRSYEEFSEILNSSSSISALISDNYQYSITFSDTFMEDYVGASSFQINSISTDNDPYFGTESINFYLDFGLADHLDYETQQEYTLPIFILEVPLPLLELQWFQLNFSLNGGYLNEVNIEDTFSSLRSPNGFWTNNTTVKVIEVPIVVLNVDEVAPIITSADVVSIADNTADGATIYTVTSTDDEDISEGVDYSITAGGENFSVNAETGAVTVNSTLEAGEYTFTVKATDREDNSTDRDGVETSQHIKTITVNVTETDTTPPIISNISSITLAENAPLQTTVATVTASDDGGAVTYSLDESSPNIFAIDSLSGVITLTAGLDYETDQQYSITVVATDPAGNEAQSPISIIVGNIDEAAPTIVAGNTTISISEDTVAGSTVSIALTTNDDDEVLDGETASLTYSLVGENRSDFVINEDTGGVSIGAAGLDFETTPEYSLKVRVTDQAGNISETDLIEIIVIDTDEGHPVITSLSTGTLTSPVPAANVTNAIYTITADDPDNTSSELTYSISNNPGSIRVDEDTGEIFLNASPGYPVTFDMDEITFDATVTDDTGLFDTEAITIEILTADTGGWG